MENQNPKPVIALLKSTWTEQITDYPFGRHRTTGKAWIEFSKSKGFRFCRELVDPKTGRVCKPKKSTYSDIALPMYDENGYFTWKSFRFGEGSVEDMPGNAARIAENWELWTPEQKMHILQHCYTYIIVNVRALYQYSGLNPENGVQMEEVCAIFKETAERIKAGMRGEISNPLQDLPVNLELYRELMAKVPQGYSPFKSQTYRIDLDAGKLVPVDSNEANQ
jgi:hypothetical protein